VCTQLARDVGAERLLPLVEGLWEFQPLGYRKDILIVLFFFLLAISVLLASVLSFTVAKIMTCSKDFKIFSFCKLSCVV